MQLFKYIDRINLLDKLIRQRRTGAQGELALRLGLSVSRLARIIEYLKDIGAPIAFDRSGNTYYYENEYSIQIKVEVQKENIHLMDIQQMKQANAGDNFVLTNYLNAFFAH
ncbi:hypothetical protein ACK8HY_09655 [Sphingobacterium sp. NGMCC 1.201703]|uniref:hypothetical protein n=1 Tax=Sphingobacterium sp. NGMCC 1.201703 TaxID=3388657 RepID=UPI0039FCD105